MKISPTTVYAVLTGDIVGSSRLSKLSRQGLPETLKVAGRETQKAFLAEVPLPVDVFRGDSWQILSIDAARSLRVALFFRALIRSGRERGRGLDTRISIGLGAIDFVPRKNISEGDGEAYRLSGRALEALPKNQYLALAASYPVEGTFSAAIGLIDAIAQDWTGPQAAAVAGALRGWTQEKIALASADKITQQSVTKHLLKSHWPVLERTLDVIEADLGRRSRPKEE